LPARQALAAKFPDVESKSQFYREIGELGNAERVVLGGAEAEALREACRLISIVATKLLPVDDALREGGVR
jgi:hypothetical protein